MPSRKFLFARYVLRSLLSIPHIGWLGAFKLFIYRYINNEFILKPKCAKEHMRLRGCTTDLSVFYSIVCHNDYFFREIKEVDYIIDCGANVGISTLHLNYIYKAKKVTAIEPDNSNFLLLRENCSHHPNIKCLKGAVWHEKTKLRIENPDAEKYAFKCTEQSDESEHGLVDSYTIDDLIKDSPDQKILVKMDIEGAENAIFKANPGWIHSINYLIIEIHPECWKAVFDQMNNIQYDCRFSGENILFVIDKNNN